MILTACILFVFLAAGWFLTERLFRPVRLADLPLHVLTISFGLFYGLTVAASFLTGMMNVWMIVAIGAGSLLAVLCWKPADYKNLLSEVIAKIKELSKKEWILWSVVSVFLIVILCLGLLLPARAWDAVGYHNHTPIQWSRTGEFHLALFQNTDEFAYISHGETFANLKAVLPFLMLELSGPDGGQGTAQWPFLLLLCTGMISLAMRMQIQRWLCPVVCLGVIGVPEVILQSTDLYSDIVLMASLICLVAHLRILWDDGFSWNRIILCAIGFVLLSGAKPSGVVFCTGLGLFFLITIFIRLDGPLHRKVSLTAASFLVVVSFCSLTTGAWAWHAWNKFGNPLHPVELAIGDTVIFEGFWKSGIASAASEGFIGRSGLDAWWYIVQEQERLTTIANWHCGTGSIFFVLGLPSLFLFLIYVIWKKEWKHQLPIIILFLICCVFAPSLVVPRMILFQTCFGILAFCYLLSCMSIRLRLLPLFIFVACIVCDSLRTFPVVLFRARPADIVVYGLTTGHTDWMTWWGFPSELHPADVWRSEARPGDRILITDEAPVRYVPFNPKATVDLMKLDFEEAFTIEDFYQKLKGDGATHVQISRLNPDFQELLESKDYFIVYARIQSSSREDSRGFVTHPEVAILELLPAEEGSPNE